jgi:acyl-CoA thioester hydrolase
VLDFEIRLVKSTEICTKGRSEQVAVKFPEMEMMLAIPDEIRLALGF